MCKPASIVIDPDSRLTQLGLLPICPEEPSTRYLIVDQEAVVLLNSERACALIPA